MAKSTIFWIVGSVLFVVLVAVSGFVVSIVQLSGLNYVQLSVNPKIEFVCDKSKVVSMRTLNEESQELMAGENFVGLEIDDAIKQFLTLCLGAGYINVDAIDNVVRLDCVSGWAFAFDVKTYKAINSFLKENQIFGTILEAGTDDSFVKEAKNLKTSVEKLILAKSLTRLHPEENFNNILKKSEKHIIQDIHSHLKDNQCKYLSYTQEDVVNKEFLMSVNREKLASHLHGITPITKEQFLPAFNRNKQELRELMKNDFVGAYELWKTNHNNFIA